MVIYNEEVIEIEDLVEELAKELISSELVSGYVTSYVEMDQNQEVSSIVNKFLEKKAAFEKIESYGKYAPDFKEKRRDVRKAKRLVDTNELVADFKYSETSLQNMLDYVTFDLANTISKDIKVDAGNPFFEFAKRGCGGSCHVS
ncbi:YlbF family regulator [Vagococcus carniphilus]|uniref:YlbF family regulator n=1 Tax=Vagococcus carniphilus TaxID=218144 RepID=A0AAW8U2U1_9ENTE|nr:YlbF family regulator [Vagococcus carniphilus]MDT2831416.1 YlbF family regulator [Vagococcus carniphilus]MDT2832639.1 YlbF family regulator [Vagococcus carniphilus]MDT2864752.1 YlbF family regulator [Vagococcus carniphilus]